ncbi:unnamed protein product [Closterium sp. NIES-54]
MPTTWSDGRSSRPFKVGELLVGLRRAAGDRCGAAIDQGARQPQGHLVVDQRLLRHDCLSSEQLRKWFTQRTRLRSRGAGARDSSVGDTGAGGVGVTTGVGGTRGATAAGPRGARTSGTGAAGTGGTGTGSAGVGGDGAIDPGAGGAGGTVGPRRYFILLLQQCPLLDQSQPPLQPATPLPAPSPYTEQLGGLTESREPVSRHASSIRIGRRVPCPRAPPVLGTHAMALRPSSVPLRVPLSPPPKSSIPAVPDPESYRARAASPTVSRLLATVITDLSFESSAASALVAELLDFAAACRLDYATALVAESESASPPTVESECALGMDVLEDRQEDLECLAATVPRFASILLAPEGDPDAPDIPTTRSYADAITVRTTLASLGFIPSTADPSLFLRTDTSLPPFYVLMYVDDLVFVTADTEALTLDRARCTITLTQSHMVHQVLQRFGFLFSSPLPTPLSTNHLVSAPSSDESVEPSGPYPELVVCLMYLMTCTRPDLAYPLSLLARYVAPVVQLSSLVTQTLLGLTTQLTQRSS